MPLHRLRLHITAESGNRFDRREIFPMTRDIDIDMAVSSISTERYYFIITDTFRKTLARRFEKNGEIIRIYFKGGDLFQPKIEFKRTTADHMKIPGDTALS